MWSLFSDVLFRYLLWRGVTAFLAHFQKVKAMPGFAFTALEEPNSLFFFFGFQSTENIVDESKCSIFLAWPCLSYANSQEQFSCLLLTWTVKVPPSCSKQLNICALNVYKLGHTCSGVSESSLLFQRWRRYTSKCGNGNVRVLGQWRGWLRLTAL